MILRLFSLLCLILALTTIQAQPLNNNNSEADRHRHAIGWNAASAFSNGYTFFGESQLQDRWYLHYSAGYQAGPGWTFFLLDDGTQDYQFEGGFASLGVLHKWKVDWLWPTINTGLVYTLSGYREQATFEDFRVRSAQGMASGFGLHFSFDYALWSPLRLRVGAQMSASLRQNYARSSTLSYQPGMGAPFMAWLHYGYLGLFWTW